MVTWFATLTVRGQIMKLQEEKKAFKPSEFDIFALMCGIEI